MSIRGVLIAGIIVSFLCNMLLLATVRSQRTTQKVPLPPVVNSNPVDLDEYSDPLVDPRTKDPEFVQVPVFRSIDDPGHLYKDVLEHCSSAPFGDRHGRSTNVHETAHGIHNYLLNKYTKVNLKMNGFYCLNGQAVVLREPNMRKSQVNEFVPDKLKWNRFNLYLVKQREWDDRPLYIFDEWTAYVLGGMNSVEDSLAGRQSEWTDGVSGCLEFSIYSIALCMAVQKHDPQYFGENEQFRLFVIWMLKKSYETYMAGHNLEKLKWDKQEMLLRDFLTDDSLKAVKMRSFLKEYLDGVWLDAEVPEMKTVDLSKSPRILGCDCQK